MSSKDKDSNKDTLDLGLGTLLESEESCSTTNNPARNADTEFATQAADDIHCEKLVESKSEFLARLWNQKEFNELVRQVEIAELSENLAEDQLELRMWWARAQVQIANMPSGHILAAIDQLLHSESSVERQNKKHINELVELTTVELSQALVAAGNQAAAISVLQVAFEINPDKHCTLLLQLVNEELQRLEESNVSFFERDRQAKYLLQLKSLKEKLTKTSRNKSFDINSSDQSVDTDWVIGQRQSPNKASNFKQTGVRKGFLLVCMLALIAVSVAYFLVVENITQFTNYTSIFAKEDTLVVVPTVDSLTTEQQLNLPEPDRKLPGVATSLDQILEDLVKNDSEPVQSAQSEQAKTKLTQVVQQSEQVSINKQVELDLKQPVELPDLAEVVMDFDAGYASDLVEDDLSRGNREFDIVAGEKPGDYIVDGYGRRSGSDSTTAPSKGLFYALMKPAIVYAGASSRSAELGQVERGQQVEVVGSAGNWRRIRSQNGRDGYISANSLSGL